MPPIVRSRAAILAAKAAQEEAAKSTNPSIMVYEAVEDTPMLPASDSVDSSMAQFTDMVSEYLHRAYKVADLSTGAD